MVDGVPYLDVYKGTDWEGPIFDETHEVTGEELSRIVVKEKCKIL